MKPEHEPIGETWPITGLLTWADAAHRRVAGVGLDRHEIIRATPWSTVVRWSTPERTVWGKAVCPGFAAECSLLPLLSGRRPDFVPAPLDVEPEHGWMLLPDGGPTMQGVATAASWRQVLLDYADLQRSVIGLERAMLDAGCPDLRPRSAVDRLERMMERGDVPEHRWIIDGARRAADRIDLTLVPATIQHDDLRPDNVFANGRLFDWGDASLAHPFASLLTALMPNRADRPGSDAEKAEMRDDYLRCWQHHGHELRVLDEAPSPSLDVLREQAELATMLAPIGRIDTWLRAPAAALDLYPTAIDRWVDHLKSTEWPRA